MIRVIDDLKEDLRTRSIRDKVMLAPKLIMDEIIGLELNNLHSCAAMVDVASRPLFQSIESMRTRKLRQHRSLSSMGEQSSSDHDPSRDQTNVSGFAIEQSISRFSNSTSCGMLCQRKRNHLFNKAFLGNSEETHFPQGLRLPILVMDDVSLAFLHEFHSP